MHGGGVNSAQAVDLELLGEAAEWLLRLREGALGPEELHAFEQWQARSSAHREAWQRAENVLQTFGNVPAEIGRKTLKNGALSAAGASRRRVLRTLGLLVVAAPAGLAAWRAQPWESWTADIATATGERRTLDLADGSHLVLNTASAVDIDFTPARRRLRLHRGEILVATGRDPSPVARPFLVESTHGSLRALGTRFSVRKFDDATLVSVFEHAVEVTQASGRVQIVEAGQQCRFGANGVGFVTAVDGAAATWEHGMLAARSMRLADVVDELARYRRGVLRCDPALANLPVTGAISLDDTDAALSLLERSLPVRISRLTPYWVSIGPA